MSQQITVVSAAQMPCDCMPGPYQCNVSTEAQLPACNRNGVVYTITAQPGFSQPYQMFCWNGVWYHFLPTAKVRGFYTQTTVQEFDVINTVTPDPYLEGNSTFSNIVPTYDPYGMLSSSSTVLIPKTGVYQLNMVIGLNTTEMDGLTFYAASAVRINGIQTVRTSRGVSTIHNIEPTHITILELNLTTQLAIGDVLTFVGGIGDTSRADYVARVTSLDVGIVEI
jgi:hypothetical protein